MEKYVLKHPITFGSEKIESLELKMPQGKHLKTLPAEPKLWNFIEIASKVSGVSITAFEEMSGEDILAIGGLVGKAVVGSQAIGA